MDITIRPETLTDRLMAHWALSRISRLRGPLPREAQRLAESFEPDTLRFLFAEAGVDERLHLLRTLPALRFAPLFDELIERWPDESRPVAWSLMETFAGLDATRALELLESWFAAHSLQQELRSLTGLTAALLALPPGNCARIARELGDFVVRYEDVHLLDLLRADLIALARRQRLPQISSLLEGLFHSTHENRYLHGNAFARCYAALTDGLPFLDWIERRLHEKSYQRLETLQPLFRDDAPLASLDALVANESGRSLERLRVLLPVQSERVHALAAARDLAGENGVAEQHESDRAVLFALALCVGAYARQSPDWAALTAGEIAALGASDLHGLPGGHGALNRLRQFPAALVSDTLEAALLENEESAGAATLAQWMGALGDPASIRPLRASLDSSINESLVEAAAEALCRFGTEAEEAFVWRWDDLTEAQQEHGAGILELVGGQRSVDLLVARRGDLRDPAAARLWIQIARGLPDPRVLRVLEEERQTATRPELDEVYLVQRVLLDRQGEDLEPIRRGLREQFFGKSRTGPEEAVWAAGVD